jgi:hypothetical protein
MYAYSMEAPRMRADIEPRPPFCASSLIAELDAGAVDGQATDLIREVTEAVEKTGKDGTVTIKITIRKEGKIAAVSAAVDAKRPQPATREMLYHFTPENNLSREDPRQETIVFPKAPTRPAT